MHLLSYLQVPRCYSQLEHRTLDVLLHHFCDASELTYAAILNVRCGYGNFCIKTRLVAAKTKEDASKKQTKRQLKCRFLQG